MGRGGRTSLVTDAVAEKRHAAIGILWRAGWSQADIARALSMSSARVHQIVRGRDTFFAYGMRPIVHDAQGGCCGHCGGVVSLDDGILHHRNGLSDGGFDEPENLVFVCRPCHTTLHRDGNKP